MFECRKMAQELMDEMHGLQCVNNKPSTLASTICWHQLELCAFFVCTQCLVALNFLRHYGSIDTIFMFLYVCRLAKAVNNELNKIALQGSVTLSSLFVLTGYMTRYVR